MTLLITDDVLIIKFEVSSFKEGYRQGKVDTFLDGVTTTIRELEKRFGTSQEPSGPSLWRAEILLTVEGVRNIRFPTVRWSGYRINRVDAFIAQVFITMEVLEVQVCTSSFVDQPGAGAGAAYGGVYGSGAYGMGPAQTGCAPGDASGTGDTQHVEVVAQRDQHIAQLQQGNAYLHAGLKSAQRRPGTTGYQSSSALRSPRLRSRWGVIVDGQGP